MGVHAYATTLSDVLKLMGTPLTTLKTPRKIAATVTSAMAVPTMPPTYALIGAYLICRSNICCRCAAGICSIWRCAKAFFCICCSMRPRHPTRWPSVATAPIETTVRSSSGTSHVGRRAIDSKVGLGLKSAPKMRLSELPDSGTSAGGIAVLAMGHVLRSEF